MKSQNIPQHTLAHPRLHRAHLHPSLRQGGRRVLAAPAFGKAANQRTFKDDPRPGRPIERAVRSASVPSQLGGFTVRRPAFSPAPWQNVAPNALNCGHCSGRRALRVLGPSAIADAAIQRSLPRIIGFCPPILSVLALPQAPAPGEKKGRRHLLRPLKRSPRKPVPGLLERPSPTDRAFLPSRSFSGVKRPSGMHFSPGKVRAGRWRSLSRHSCACQARFGGSHLFSNPPTNNRNKVYGTQTK